MIVTKNLSYIYGEASVALRNISFTLEDGAHLAVLGAKGAGKSTLLKLLSGVLSPIEGAVSIDGLLPDDKKTVGLIGYASLTSSLDPSLTVTENLAFMAEICGLDKSAAEKAAELVGLSEQELCVPFGTLPRLASRLATLAAAIIEEPKYLLLDELLTGLSRKDSGIMAELLSELSQSFILIFATESPAEAKKYCSAALVIDEGKQIAFGNIDGLLTSTEAAEAVFKARLKGDEDALSSALEELKEVTEFSVKTLPSGKLLAEISVEGDAENADEIISAAIVNAGCSILEFKKAAASSDVDKVFSELTDKDEEREAKEAELENEKAPPIKLDASMFSIFRSEESEEEERDTDDESDADDEGDGE